MDGALGVRDPMNPLRMSHLTRIAALGLLLFSAIAIGCAPPKSCEGPTPVVIVAPGFRERLAWMDRVRLHDDARFWRTPRPTTHVWVEVVEEASSDGAMGDGDGADAQ